MAYRGGVQHCLVFYCSSNTRFRGQLRTSIQVWGTGSWAISFRLSVSIAHPGTPHKDPPNAAAAPLTSPSILRGSLREWGGVELFRPVAAFVFPPQPRVAYVAAWCTVPGACVGGPHAAPVPVRTAWRGVCARCCLPPHGAGAGHDEAAHHWRRKRQQSRSEGTTNRTQRRPSRTATRSGKRRRAAATARRTRNHEQGPPKQQRNEREPNEERRGRRGMANSPVDDAFTLPREEPRVNRHSYARNAG